VRKGKGKTEEDITEGKTKRKKGEMAEEKSSCNTRKKMIHAVLVDGRFQSILHLHFFVFKFVNTFFACNDCHEKESAV
jgi:hypothetical protein